MRRPNAAFGLRLAALTSVELIAAVLVKGYFNTKYFSKRTMSSHPQPIVNPEVKFKQVLPLLREDFFRLLFTIQMLVPTSLGSVSVFQVGVGFSV